VTQVTLGQSFVFLSKKCFHLATAKLALAFRVCLISAASRQWI